MVPLWFSFGSLSPSSVTTMEARSKKRKLRCRVSESYPHRPRIIATEITRIQTIDIVSAVMRLHDT